MKYIVKNCPAFWKHSEIKALMCINGKECVENTDCLLKRIAELCKKEPQNIMLISNGCAYGTEENKAYCLAQDILNLLEIEEVKCQ